MPAVNSIVAGAPGVNLTIQCSVFNDQDEQVITQWHFQSSKDDALQVVTLVFSPASVIVDGTPNPSVFFPTFRDRITFIAINQSFDIVLFCGAPPNLQIGRFLIGIIGKCVLQWNP